jgi:hypothetical protein
VPSHGPTPFVLIVSRNTATAQSLHEYFAERGVGASMKDTMNALDDGRITAVVAFPDEFPEHSATEGIVRLAGRFANAWLVIVTRDVVRFEGLAAAMDEGDRGRWFVLPRPSWGWALLDRVLQPLPPP